ncbi:hypothetical protein A3Q56_07919 [Intoshia linei]|uniref:Tc1-like transposase DDE domain-containing protein n=1 Tax=Intoshia linei TaxID=1819745 RepID=A0A177ARC1_9BILA|nr:hypothetical protein A3Q56_07919 [Intoshia linei]
MIRKIKITWNQYIQHKGRRYYIIAAIISEDPKITEQQAHLIKDTIDIFVGEKTKDYHGMFTNTYFIKWMNRLLIYLKNTVIILDNVKYHKCLPLNTPKKCHINPIICEMAAKQGHSVMFTPPYHSDLQPIELIWAIIKGEVGRQYDVNTNFNDVLLRLNEAFNNLPNNVVKEINKYDYNIINKIGRIFSKMTNKTNINQNEEKPNRQKYKRACKNSQ